MNEVDKEYKPSEEEIENTKEKKTSNNKRNITYLIVFLGIFFIISIINVSYYEDKVYPRVYLYGEELNKLSDKELDEKILMVKKQIDEKIISIKDEKNKYEIKLNELVTNYNTKEIKEEILRYGKDEKLLKQIQMTTFPSKKNYNLSLTVDKEAIDKEIEKLYNLTYKKDKDAKILIDGQNISYIDERYGRELNKEKIRKDIIDKIGNINNSYKFESVKSEFIVKEPDIKVSDIQNIDTKISTYDTYYNSVVDRGKNVRNASESVDDMIIMPGEEFSYKEAIKEVSIENGYTYAPVIIDGELKPGIGGGICQVSSTIYNAQLMAGILPTERRNHSKPVSYVPRGLDATFASGSIDYKFKNEYEYPIAINSYSIDNRIYVEIWSNENLTEGILYKPVSYVSGNVANTYLFGYDKNGKEVYQKHIDYSTYR